MLELVIKENQQLKEENSRLKARQNSLPSTSSGIENTQTTSVGPAIAATVASDILADSEDEMPPLKRRADNCSGKPSKKKFLEELEAKMEARFQKLEDMLASFAEATKQQIANLNARVLGLENAATLVQQTSATGPHKLKPYSRPHAGDNIRTMDAQNGHHGPE